MRWRITLLRLVRTKGLLRSVLRRAGVDETVRRRCWLQKPWSRLVGTAVCLIALFIGGEDVGAWPNTAAMTVVLLLILPIAFNRTLVIVGDSKVSVVESAGVTVLSSSAVLLASRDTSNWSKRFDVAIRDVGSAWRSRLASEKDFTALEAEWQRLGLPSKSVLALP